MRIASLHLYPVKSTHPYDVSSAVVEPAGLVGDRRWLVIDPAGAKVNAIRHPAILSIRSTPNDTGVLLQAAGHPDLHVATPRTGPEVPVKLSRQGTLRLAEGDSAAWLSSVLDVDVRLAWQDDAHQRSISASHGGEDGEALSLADTAPILLTTTASLAALNAWIAEGPEPTAIPMERFRPNVVIDGDLEPFVEDQWRGVRLGEVMFRFTELCDRCAIPTIDLATLAHGKEPTRTLARRRRWDRTTWFGVRMAPTSSGTLHVGDPAAVVTEAAGPRATGIR